MKKIIIAGNWKMNKTPSQAKQLLEEIIPSIKKSSTRVMVAPSFVCLPAAAQILQETSIDLAAQNMAEHESGAYTGETSPAMLKDLGVKAVILGHSERRQYYKETDQSINNKVKLALKHGLEPLLCVGETLEEREMGKAFEKVKMQLEASLQNISEEQAAKAIIAYEPVWAIGTGKTASAAEAQEVHAHIRSVLEKLYSRQTAAAIAILYGGSVNPTNIEELIGQPDINGALIGGASLDAGSFGILANSVHAANF